MVMGPSLSQGSVSMSSPCASLCVILLRATSTQAAELTQYAATPASSGISCAMHATSHNGVYQQLSCSCPGYAGPLQHATCQFHMLGSRHPGKALMKHVHYENISE